jgi:hypothetical protein
MRSLRITFAMSSARVSRSQYTLAGRMPRIRSGRLTTDLRIVLAHDIKLGQSSTLLFRTMPTLWPSEIKEICQNYTGKVSVIRERLNLGGYTRDGVYFGIGQPLYFVQDEDGFFDQYFRAADRAEAVEIARERYPNARIRR